MLVTLRNIFFKKKKDKKKPTLRDKIEKYTEAITFAEADALDEEQRKSIVEPSERKRVVVLSKEYDFSKQAVDYALNFAKRLGYDIVALNVGPIPKHLNSLKDYCDPLCEQFTENCNGNVEKFKKSCEENGIDFIHVVKFGDVNSCLSEIDREFDKVEYVIGEPKKKIDEDYIVPVFCVCHYE